MENVNFEINRRIEFVLKDKYKAASLVQEVEDDGLYVTIPWDEDSRKLLDIGDSVEVIYYDKKSVFGFMTRVVGRKTDNIPLYKIAKPIEIYKIQRRHLVRIEFTNGVEYVQYPVNENIDKSNLIILLNEMKDKGEIKSGVTVDISGGGARLRTSQPLELNKKLILSINLPSFHLTLIGKVLRVEKELYNNKIVYHSGIEFINISENDKEKIIEFIFVRMRELRNKLV